MQLLITIITIFVISGCVNTTVAKNKTNTQVEKNQELDALADRVLKCKFCVGYNGPGGPCYKKAGGDISAEPGGFCYTGPGSSLYSGAGGALSTSPGGACSEHPGGNCWSGPGSDGKNCPLACRLNRKTVVR
jgi:hypothetical protein